MMIKGRELRQLRQNHCMLQLLMLLIALTISTSIVAVVFSAINRTENSIITSSLMNGLNSVKVHEVVDDGHNLNAISFHSKKTGTVQSSIYSYVNSGNDQSQFSVYVGIHDINFLGEKTFAYRDGELQSISSNAIASCTPTPALTARSSSDACPNKKLNVGVSHRLPNSTLQVNGTLSVSEEATFDSLVTLNHNINISGSIILHDIIIGSSISVQNMSGYLCWDLNQNRACDLGSEDFNNDGECSIADCNGVNGTNGQNGKTCWDLNGNGNCNLLTEDRNEDGSCNITDCEGNSNTDNGFKCWDLNQNQVCNLAQEDKNNDGVCNVDDCNGIDAPIAVRCWDLNTNGVCDLPSEDTNGDGSCTYLDCTGSEIFMPGTLSLINNGWESINPALYFTNAGSLVFCSFSATNAATTSPGSNPTFSIPNGYAPDSERTAYGTVIKVIPGETEDIFVRCRIQISFSETGVGTLQFIESNGTLVSWPFTFIIMPAQTFLYDRVNQLMG